MEDYMGDDSKAEKIQVMVVDDHFVARKGLIESVNLEADMTVQCEASTGAEAIALYRQHRPDLVLMDLRLPDISGAEATQAIRKEFPSAAVIILSVYDGEEDIYQSLKVGAITYVLKAAPREELIETIRAVHAGECRISPVIGARLAGRMRRPDLTSRQLDVLRLIVKGRSNKEIAEELAITIVTVKLHVGQILTKLGASDRTQAAMTALQRGIIHSE
ncbi:MAG: response regulator transcription factor [Verrucomicrobiota bacterium]